MPKFGSGSIRTARVPMLRVMAGAGSRSALICRALPNISRIDPDMSRLRHLAVTSLYTCSPPALPTIFPSRRVGTCPVSRRKVVEGIAA